MTIDPNTRRMPSPRGPLEERSLFNPAFIAVLLHRAVRSWGRERQDGMHVILSYLIVPVALHSPMRAILPRTKKSPMLEWVQSNPESQIYIPNSAVALRGIVSRGLELGIRTGALVSLGAGIVGAGELKKRTKKTVFTEDFEECIKASEFLGKWFAQQNDYATILAAWGVRP